MATPTDPAGLRHMRTALALARRGVGRTAPNPAVGCVLVRPDVKGRGGGQVVGRGWTQPGGRPHAETEALARAGDLAKGATAYVSLEPCAHHGETGPCAAALAAAGVARVVVACGDPDPRVAGQGIAALEAAGIEVEAGLLEAEARDLNRGFLSRVERGRPWLTLKTATSLDGRIATATGDSKWITGETSRARGHLLRARNDALLTGIGTVLADDPSFTCRLPGMDGRTPLRVVTDGHLRLPTGGALAHSARKAPVLAVCGPNAPGHARTGLQAAGVEVLAAQALDATGRPDLGWLLGVLAARGINNVLVEGGAALTAALLTADLVDEIVWFRAPVLIGGDGLGMAAPLGVERLAAAPRFERIALATCGADVVETYRRAASGG